MGVLCAWIPVSLALTNNEMDGKGKESLGLMPRECGSSLDLFFQMELSLLYVGLEPKKDLC